MSLLLFPPFFISLFPSLELVLMIQDEGWGTPYEEWLGWLRVCYGREVGYGEWFETGSNVFTRLMSLHISITLYNYHYLLV